MRRIIPLNRKDKKIGCVHLSGRSAELRNKVFSNLCERTTKGKINPFYFIVIIVASVKKQKHFFTIPVHVMLPALDIPEITQVFISWSYPKPRGHCDRGY